MKTKAELKQILRTVTRVHRYIDVISVDAIEDEIDSLLVKIQGACELIQEKAEAKLGISLEENPIDQIRIEPNRL